MLPMGASLALVHAHAFFCMHTTPCRACGALVQQPEFVLAMAFTAYHALVLQSVSMSCCSLSLKCSLYLIAAALLWELPGIFVGQGIGLSRGEGASSTTLTGNTRRA